MQTAEIRRRFLEHFAQRGHTVVPSASLVSPDPSLLFTVAGMVPFIPYLTGREPAPYPRATSVQKCVRTLDIEEVGKTTRHGTFFQMNGNFSFGDYFKEGAIRYAWELLTGSVDDGGLGFDPEKIWVTVYQDDDEAADAWHRIAGLPEERIQRLRHEGQLLVDRRARARPAPARRSTSTAARSTAPTAARRSTRRRPLPRDLEPRLHAVRARRRARARRTSRSSASCRRRTSTPAWAWSASPSSCRASTTCTRSTRSPRCCAAPPSSPASPTARDHEADVRLRVVADHVRSGLMLIGDGVTPGNEGRGYILRRLLRRAVRSMRLLGVDEATLPELLPVSRDAMSASYPELATDFARISGVAYAEEEAFRRTLVGRDDAVRHRRRAGEEGRHARRCPATRRSRCTTPTASRSTSPSRWPPSRA